MSIDILIAGDPKTGKTVSAATFPKPMLYLDCDGNGCLSIQNAKDASGKLIISAEEFKEITIVPFKRTKVIPFDFSGEKKSQDTCNYTEGSRIVSEINKVFLDLAAGKGYANNNVLYKSIVIDSTTSLFQFWKETVMFRSNIAALRQQDYGVLHTVLFSQLLPTLRVLPVDYVIVISHLETDRSADSLIAEYPVGPTKNQGKNIAKDFTEVWKQRLLSGKRVWSTRPYGFFNAGSRHHFPDPIEANYNALKPYLQTKKEN